jgi:hypothetical protein
MVAFLAPLVPAGIALTASFARTVGFGLGIGGLSWLAFGQAKKEVNNAVSSSFNFTTILTVAGIGLAGYFYLKRK